MPTARNTSAASFTPRGQIGGEVQPLGIAILLDQFGQAGLVDRNLAGIESRNLRLVDIDAGHVVAALGEARARD